MDCRPGCGACCIAPSINTPIPGMPNGKAAGELCVNLDPKTFACVIWGTEEYPELCKQFSPNEDTCGNTREEALRIIGFLEIETG